MLTAENTISVLQKKKDRGGLIIASEDVVRICQIAEKIIRSFQSLYLQYFTKTRFKNATINSYHDFLSKMDHMMQQGPLSDHRTQLLKLILNKYFTVRLHHHGTSKKDSIRRIRNFHTKLITFKNQ